MRSGVFLVVLLLTGPAYAQKPWTPHKRPDEAQLLLADKTKWEEGLKDNLARLLGAIELQEGPDYIVVVIGETRVRELLGPRILRWHDIYLIPRGCWSDKTKSIPSECDPKSTRIRNSTNVSIVGLSLDEKGVSWKYSIIERERLRFSEFLMFIAPSIGGAFLAQAQPGVPPEKPPQFYSLQEDVANKKLPVNIEVKADVVADGKSQSVTRVFENYGDEFVSFGVGVGVRNVEEINLNLQDASLVATEVDKLKSYGLVNIHPVRIDPHQPRTWNLPHFVAGVEINKDQFNYGFGVGWRLPFIDDTSISVLGINALPEASDNAKGKAEATTGTQLIGNNMVPMAAAGASETDTTKRSWKAIFMIQYAFPLPKKAKETK